MSEWQPVLLFWFGELEDDGTVKPEVRARWFKKDAAFDEEIRSRFGELHAAIARGEHADWREDAHGALAAVIVLDQFSRNMFRGTAEMFKTDDLALSIAEAAIKDGFDVELPWAMQSFLYMPFMHSESLANQNRCIDLFAAAVDAGGAGAEVFASNHGYAIRHRDIVERFGRFPHRNDVLSRESTDEETEFLTGPGSSF